MQRNIKSVKEKQLLGRHLHRRLVKPLESAPDAKNYIQESTEQSNHPSLKTVVLIRQTYYLQGIFMITDY